jgi:cobalt-zinc-cadmium efflux system outer membrane protein
LRRVWLLAGLLAAPSAVAAQQDAPVVDWPQVVAAVEAHPLVLEASSRVGAASGAVTEARELPNPALSVTAGEARDPGGSGSGREREYAVELPLDFLRSRRQRVAAASASAEGAREEAREIRLQALRELRRSFVAVAHDQAVLAARSELEAQVAQLASLIRRRADRGEGRPVEVPRIELELERLRVAVGRARAAAEAQRHRLGAWLGRPVAGVQADLSRSFELPPLEELQRRTLEASPRLRAGRARVEAADEGSSAARWDRLPALSLGAARAEDPDRKATTVTATVTLPLWNWSLGKIRQADSALAGERARLDAATRELSASLAEAWHGCSAGQAAATRFRDEILPRAEASARTLARAFELGESGLLDVIDSRRVLLDTRSEYLDLLLDMQNACGDLAALAELELP